MTGPIFNTMYRILDRKELDVVEFKINEKVLSKSVVDYLSNLSAYQPQAYNLRVIKSGLNDEIQVEMQQVPAETSFAGLLDRGTSASIRLLHCSVSDKGVLVCVKRFRNGQLTTCGLMSTAKGSSVQEFMERCPGLAASSIGYVLDGDLFLPLDAQAKDECIPVVLFKEGDGLLQKHEA